MEDIDLDKFMRQAPSTVGIYLHGAYEHLLHLQSDKGKRGQWWRELNADQTIEFYKLYLDACIRDFEASTSAVQSRTIRLIQED